MAKINKLPARAKPALRITSYVEAKTLYTYASLDFKAKNLTFALEQFIALLNSKQYGKILYYTFLNNGFNVEFFRRATAAEIKAENKLIEQEEENHLKYIKEEAAKLGFFLAPQKCE